MSITLYHLPLCPFSRAVRLTLAEKKLDAALEEVEPWAADDSFWELNNAGEVPALTDRRGVKIGESVAIMEYLDEAYPQPPLHGHTVERRAEVRRLLLWFTYRFTADVTRLVWGEKIYRKMKREQGLDSARVRIGMGQLDEHLRYIDHLFRERNWLAGERLSLADLCAAAHLSVLDYLGDVPWNRHEGARDWYAKIKSRPSFRGLLNDRVVGFRPAPHYAILDF